MVWATPLCSGLPRKRGESATARGGTVHRTTSRETARMSSLRKERLVLGCTARPSSSYHRVGLPAIPESRSRGWGVQVPVLTYVCGGTDTATETALSAIQDLDRWER